MAVGGLGVPGEVGSPWAVAPAQSFSESPKGCSALSRQGGGGWSCGRAGVGEEPGLLLCHREGWPFKGTKACG